MEAATDERARVLVVDDNRSIHDDFRKVLDTCHGSDAELDGLEADLFGADQTAPVDAGVEIDSAYQGQEAIAAVGRARHDGRPFSVAFVDVRMPPGIDGIETTARLWEHDPDLQVVICSAYSDYSWDQTVARLGQRDSLLILRKPFDASEVSQLVTALTRKWRLGREARDRLTTLEAQVRSRTADLQRANAELQGEIQRRERLEAERRLSNRLEAVGELAAGIAHEINTPMQYIGDNVRFLQEAFAPVRHLVEQAGALLDALPPSEARAEAVRRYRAALADADFEFLAADAPDAFAKTLDGVSRVTTIVKAMRDFAHPGQDSKAEVDVNAAVATTLTVCRNEYKYVADIETDLAQIPPIQGYASGLNQVLLNLIVNAAQAIAQNHDPDGPRGTIRITTALDADHVVIEIADDGPGIPESIRDRIYDPFFTTKDVGHGTGQGLARSRSIVVDKHGGSIACDSAPGRGATFQVRLPVIATRAAAEESGRVDV